MPDALPTIGEALRNGARFLKESETPQLDARTILKHVLRADDSALIANADSRLGADDYKRYLKLLDRRAAAEPEDLVGAVAPRQERGLAPRRGRGRDGLFGFG